MSCTWHRKQKSFFTNSLLVSCVVLELIYYFFEQGYSEQAMLIILIHQSVEYKNHHNEWQKNIRPPKWHYTGGKMADLYLQYSVKQKGHFQITVFNIRLWQFTSTYNRKSQEITTPKQQHYYFIMIKPWGFRYNHVCQFPIDFLPFTVQGPTLT